VTLSYTPETYLSSHICAFFSLRTAVRTEISNESIVGWAALSPVSARSVYAGVAEVSVYIASQWHGKGIGRALLETLVNESERNGIWTLQASIFPGK